VVVMAMAPLVYGLSQNMAAWLSSKDPDEAAAPSMPRAAVLADHPDACLPVEEIDRRVCAFCSDSMVT
jgi:chemotaxis response regulator CheB